MRKIMYLMGVLDDADIDWIAEHGAVRTIDRGVIIIHEGQPAQHVYILLDGALAVKVGDKQVAALYSGELVGEISFVDSRPPLATVVSAEQSRVLTIARPQLQKKLDSDYKFAANFYRAIAIFLAERLRTTTGRLGYGNAQQDRPQAEPDEITDDLMDSASLGVVRFDAFLKRLRVY